MSVYNPTVQVQFNSWFNVLDSCIGTEALYRPYGP